MNSQEQVDKILRLQVRLEMLSKSTGIDLSKLISQRFKRLTAEVASGSVSNRAVTSSVVREFDRIIKAVEQAQAATLEASIIGAGLAGASAEITVSGASASSVTLTNKRILNSAFAHIMQEHDMSVEQAWDKYLRTSSTRLKNIPRQAYQNGWSVTTMVDKLRNATTIDRRSATTMARTAILSASNVSREITARRLGADKQLFVATLDSKTTAICQYNDGKIFDVEKGAQPPLHLNCRSVRVAVPSDMEPAEFKKSLERGQRGQSGQTTHVDYTNYGGWLKTQPLSFQREVLGTKRAQLFNDGKITFSKLFTRDGHYMSVKDLEKRYK